MFLRDGGGVGLNVEVWRLLSKYAFLFSKKEGRGGALPLPIPPVQCCCYSFKSRLFQNNRHCLGERGAAEIGSYNKITKFLKNTS